MTAKSGAARFGTPEEATEDSSFARGLRVLLVVSDRGVVRADELAVALETPVSTVYRYLRTLVEFGFVERNGSEYRLGPRLVIGGPQVTSALLVRIAQPALRSLAVALDETVLLLRRVGSAAVVLDAVESGPALRVTVQPGSSFPLHLGAGPKSLLAGAPPEVIDEVILGLGADELPSAWGLDATAQDRLRDAATGDRLRRELEQIRIGALVEGADEMIEGTSSVAAPIVGPAGVVGAVAAMGPTSRCGPAWQRRAIRAVSETAATIAAGIAAGEG